jgi:ABC-type glycerol-3-phosphate transport system substrate-binding protein
VKRPTSRNYSVKSQFSLAAGCAIVCLLLATTASLTGCQSGALQPIISPMTAGNIEKSTSQPEIIINPTATSAASANASVQIITLWLPPQFAPDESSSAGILLETALQTFAEQHPGVQIKVRIKAASGASGLLSSLSAASAAAPAALPSIVVLSRPDLETAVLKNLVLPLNNIPTLDDEQDWYPYAHELGRVQGVLYGAPFAGDVPLLVYRPASIGIPPTNWDTILRRGQPLLFTAADQQGLLSLAMYQSLGGKIVDEQNRPLLEKSALKAVLDFYALGGQQGVFPSWVATYQTDEQVWKAYLEQRANWAVTWSSNYLNQLPVDTIAAPLPALGDIPPSTATGWLWAIAEPNSDLQPLCSELIALLVSAEFLQDWGVSSDYLPVRPSTVEAIPNKTIGSLVEQVALTALPRPENHIISALGPLLRDACVDVIANRRDTDQTAQSAVDVLNSMRQ